VNDELEAFTYSASHDLRVPLHHIHGFAQAILEDREARLSPSGHANMRLILNAAERMDTLIMDLLAYSRLSRAEILVQPTAIEPILNDVLAQHRATIQAKHAVIQIERPLPDVPADRVGLQQILFNLVGNALKFTPPAASPRSASASNAAKIASASGSRTTASASRSATTRACSNSSNASTARATTPAPASASRSSSAPPSAWAASAGWNPRSATAAAFGWISKPRPKPLPPRTPSRNRRRPQVWRSAPPDRLPAPRGIPSSAP